MNNNIILNGYDIDGDIIVDRRSVLERLERQAIEDKDFKNLTESNECRFCGKDLDCRYYASKTGDTLCEVAEIIYNEKNKKTGGNK
jgi:hypothetical protein